MNYSLHFKIDSEILKKFIHMYVTRRASKSNYFLLKVYKTASQNKLTHCGVKLWNKISDS